jgi:mono/diheme cytochrome c family protein
MKFVGIIVALCAGAVVGACAEQRRERLHFRLADIMPVRDVKPPARTRTRAALPLTPVDGQRGGSALVLAFAAGPNTRGGLLARADRRLLAIAADEDGRALRVLAPDSRKEIVAVRTGGRPSQMVVGGDGRLYATLRDRNEVVAIEVASIEPLELREEGRVSTPVEPFGIAVTPDGNRLLITSAWAHTVTSLALPSWQRLGELSVPREPRSVITDREGKYAYVTHAVGSTISKVAIDEVTNGMASNGSAEQVLLGGRDFTPQFSFRGCCFDRIRHDRMGDPIDGLIPISLPRRPGRTEWIEATRFAVQGFALAALGDRLFAPNVLVHHAPATMSSGYGSGPEESYPPHEPALTVIDAKGVRTRVANADFDPASSRQGFEGGHSPQGCLLPRAAAADSHSDVVLVGCAGTDEVLAYHARDGALSLTRAARWSVPSGPLGIAIDSESRRAWVWSQYDRALSTLELSRITKLDPKKPLQLRMVPAVRAASSTVPALTDEIEGLSAQARVGRKLFHGASDSRLSSDGRACASCHPDGREDALTWPTPNGPRQTPMLAGRLDPATAPFSWEGDAPTVAAHLKHTFERLGGSGLQGAELDALLAYLKEQPTPTLPKAPAGDDAAVARGRELFHSESTGCASCHKNAVGSDGSRHLVGSGAELETPSLRFVAGTGPFFHDGRFRTLEQLLRETKGKMGWAPNLSDDDIHALAAYLKTL